MDAVGMAVAAVFADANLARDVVYRVNGGTGVTIRAIYAAPDVTTDFYENKAKVTGRRLDIQVSDVAQPSKSDLIDIDSVTYRIADFDADKRRVIWKLVLKEN